jgi:hypothetical protein
MFWIVSWTLRGIAAIILLQTLFFKFTGAKESVYIFSTVGKALGLNFMEPWGRIGSGVVELIAAVLLLIPGTVVYGAITAMGVIGGAIFFHLTILGVQLTAVDDHGELFVLALVVFLASVVILAMHRSQIPFIGRPSATAVMAAKR